MVEQRYLSFLLQLFCLSFVLGDLEVCSPSYDIVYFSNKVLTDCTLGQYLSLQIIGQGGCA